MVKMYVLQCKNDEVNFTKGEYYIGRTTKSANISAKNNKGKWEIVENYKMTVNPFKWRFDIVEEFFAKNHKEAIEFEIDNFVGVHTIPAPDECKLITYDYQKVSDYCKMKGIRTTDMSKEEWALFELKDDVKRLF